MYKVWLCVINIIGIFIKREKSENLKEIKEKQKQLLRESLLSDQKVLAVPFNNIIKILLRLYLYLSPIQFKVTNSLYYI